MSSATATKNVVRLNFSDWVNRQITPIARDLGTKIKREVEDHAPSWVACHTRDTETIQLVVPRNHPYWSEKLKKQIVDRLKFHKNAAGRIVNFEVVPA